MSIWGSRAWHDDTETGGVIGAAEHDVETGGASDFEVSIRLCV